jgi:hypothetical protein
MNFHGATVQRIRVRNDEILNAMETRRQEFIAKFGREPKATDPVWFDPDKDTPVDLSAEDDRKAWKEFAESLARKGTPPEVCYAVRKTGIYVSESNHLLHSESNMAKWHEAIREYIDASLKRPQ